MKRRCKRCQQYCTLDALRALQLSAELKAATEPENDPVIGTAAQDPSFKFGWLAHCAYQVAFELDGHCPSCALIKASERREQQRQQQKPAASA